MKKFAKIAAVLAALVIGLACIAACSDDESGENKTSDWQPKVTKEQWEKSFTTDGYTQKIHLTIKLTEGEDNGFYQVLINGEDFKIRIDDKFDGSFTRSYYAKKDGKFYYAEDDNTPFSEVTDGDENWGSMPKTSKEVFEYFLEENEIIPLKDKYDEFTYSEKEFSYLANFDTYGTDEEHKLTDASAEVVFTNAKKLCKIELKGTYVGSDGESQQAELILMITDSSSVGDDADFTVETDTKDVDYHKSSM